MRTTITSPRLLASVMDALDTPMVLVDVAGLISYVNTALRKRLPAKHNCHIGASFADTCKIENPGNDQRSHCVVTAGHQPIAGILKPLFDASDALIGHAFMALPPFMQTWTDMDDLLNRGLRWETAIESADQAVWDTWTTDGKHFVSDTWHQIRGVVA